MVVAALKGNESDCHSLLDEVVVAFVVGIATAAVVVEEEEVEELAAEPKEEDSVNWDSILPLLPASVGVTFPSLTVNSPREVTVGNALPPLAAPSSLLDSLLLAQHLLERSHPPLPLLPALLGSPHLLALSPSLPEFVLERALALELDIVLRIELVAPAVLERLQLGGQH